MNVDKLYRLAYITRFSNMPRIKNENVAEHSFFVAVEVLNLFEEYSFDLGEAILMAITHDFLEADIDDINHLIKHKYPDINKAIKAAEREEAKQYPDYLQDILKTYSRNDDVESRIVHLADCLQCITYAKNEVRLGNHGYMNEVVEKATQRSIILREELERYKL